jgi:hypothetical protein
MATRTWLAAVLRMTGSRDEAGDLAQEVLLRVWRASAGSAAGPASSPANRTHERGDQIPAAAARRRRPVAPGAAA